MMATMSPLTSYKASEVELCSDPWPDLVWYREQICAGKVRPQLPHPDICYSQIEGQLALTPPSPRKRWKKVPVGTQAWQSCMSLSANSDL